MGQQVVRSFDSLDHELVVRAVRHRTRLPWIPRYVERWLKAPLQEEDGRLVGRTRGSPQGWAISPLLANLFGRLFGRGGTVASMQP